MFTLGCTECPCRRTCVSGIERHNAMLTAEASPTSGQDDDEPQKHAAPARSWGSWFGNAALTMLAAGVGVAIIALSASDTPQQPSYPCPQCGTPYQWYQWSPSGGGSSPSPGPRYVHRHEQTQDGPQLGLFPACSCPPHTPRPSYPCPRCRTPYQWYQWSPSGRGSSLAPGPRDVRRHEQTSGRGPPRVPGLIDVHRHEQTRDGPQLYQRSPSGRGPPRVPGPSDVYRHEQTRDGPQLADQGLFPACSCSIRTQSSPTDAPTRYPSAGHQEHTTRYPSSQQYLGGVPTTPYANANNTARPYGSPVGFYGNVYDGRSQTAMPTFHGSPANFASVPIGGGPPALAREQGMASTIPPITSAPLWSSHATRSGAGPNLQGTRSVTNNPLSSRNVTSEARPNLQETRTKTPNYVSDGNRTQAALGSPSISSSRGSHRNLANSASVSISERGPASASGQRTASMTPQVTSVSLSPKNVTRSGIQSCLILDYC